MVDGSRFTFHVSLFTFHVSRLMFSYEFWTEVGRIAFWAMGVLAFQAHSANRKSASGHRLAHLNYLFW